MVIPTRMSRRGGPWQAGGPSCLQDVPKAGLRGHAQMSLADSARAYTLRVDMSLFAFFTCAALLVQDPEPQKGSSEPQVSTRSGAMPLFPDDTGLTFRVHMLRPQFRLETREFDVGSFSGPMDLHEICGLPETGWGAELLMGGESYRVSMFATFQKGKVVTDEAVTLEQHVFPPGTRLETFAHLVTLEGFWRHAFIGGRE